MRDNEIGPTPEFRPVTEVDNSLWMS